MNRARALSAWILSLALCAAGCSMKADVAKAGAQVSHFHAQLDGRDYSTITGGDAREEFVWAKSGDSRQLLNYQINSNALITR